jgi:hypothetical protein
MFLNIKLLIFQLKMLYLLFILLLFLNITLFLFKIKIISDLSFIQFQKLI